MTRRILTHRVALLALLAVLIGCGRALLRDPSFDAWCGAELCVPWEADGKVERVGTWRKTDYGVSLGDGATLSQVFDGAPVECVQLEVIADVDARADVRLQMDFRDDGSVDYEQLVPASRWAKLDYLIRMPTWYGKARLSLHKQGKGRAVLAQIKATESGDCEGPAPELVDRPLGASCETRAQCTSGACAAPPLLAILLDAGNEVCSLCEEDDDCDEGEVCGAAIEDGALQRACRPEGARPLGDLCAIDGECASGVCCKGSCSECCADTEAGDTCEGLACVGYAEDEDFSLFAPLFLCDRGERPAEPGTSCAVDADCDSGDCMRPAGECLVPCEEHASCSDPERSCRLTIHFAGTCR